MTPEHAGEWRPGSREGAWWSAAGLVLMAVGLVIFGSPVLARSGRLVVEVGLSEIAEVIALVVILVLFHEAIHAVVMSVFGARPAFGATLVGGVLPAAYTTARGHLFTRPQYLAVAVTPAILISAVGFGACFTALGAYLVIPLAMHLGGCVGDAVAGWHVVRQPPGMLCEDLRDGIRFHRGREGTS